MLANAFVMMLAMVSLHSLMELVLFRVGKERLGRRETLVHLELLDQPASVGPPGTTAPREIPYVSSTKLSRLMLFVSQSHV